MSAANLAVLEVLDRDGHVRHYLPVRAWPVSAGRALDNDLVVADPHVAPRHFRVDADADGVFVEVGDTRNGLRAERRRLAAGERIRVGDAPLHLDVGDSHLVLRLASHALEPEAPLPTPHSVWHAAWPTLGAAVLVLAVLLFGTWLETDPDDWTRMMGTMLVAALAGGFVWCAGWALLSKIFTRRNQFWWHVRVLLLGVLAIELATAASRLLAFTLSLPVLSDFSFVPVYALATAMLYYHVLGVEPRRRRHLRTMAAGVFVTGTALACWFNLQNRDQLGEELYMTHLFPPALRLARPVDTKRFVDELAPLQEILDEKAKKRESGGDDGAVDEE